MTERKRVFVAGIASESHGFNKFPTTLESFTGSWPYFVEEHDDLERFEDGDYYFGGYMDVAREQDWELVIGVYGWAWPAGPVTEHAFESLWQRIESQIKKEGPFDAFLLPLHGGMACEHLDDPEGEFINRIRSMVGRDVPISVSLDLHANLSPEFVKNCDIICGFHTAPHTDIRKTATRSASLLARTLNGEIKPQCHSIHPPMIFGIDAGRTTVPHAPMFALLRRAEEMQRLDPQFLDASFFASFPFADQSWTGPSAVIVMNGESKRADDYLDEFAAEIWRTRDVTTIDIVSIDEAIRAVKASEDDPRPFLLGDFSDAPYAGGYGDATALLSAMIKQGVERAVFGPLFDAETVAQAQEAGVGAEIDVVLGGKCDPQFGGGPIRMRAKVNALSDGQFVHKGPYLKNQPGTLGESCCLDVGGVQVIVNTFPSQIHDREQLKLFGLKAEEMNVIVAKAYNHMRADFEPLGRGLLYPDSGGLFSPNYARFPFKNIRRPIHPLDEFEISPAEMSRT